MELCRRDLFLGSAAHIWGMGEEEIFPHPRQIEGITKYFLVLVEKERKEKEKRKISTLKRDTYLYH